MPRTLDNFAVITGSVSRRAGGLFESVRRLHQEIATFNGNGTVVFALADDFTATDVAQWKPLQCEICRCLGPRSVGYSPNLKSQLFHHKPILAHVHGIWQALSVVVNSWHKRTGHPYLISPRGMLDSWALRNSRWKKQLAFVLYERRHLRNAACLHALNDAERVAIRDFGLRTPVAVIPNGVALPTLNGSQTKGNGRKTLLFLGRLHEKKGLIPLMHAWAALGKRYRDEWRLAIAGWDDRGHEAEVRATAESLGVESTIEFLGPRFGDEKEQVLRQASAFVLPSFSEGLPMAVLEAWSYGLPVLMTPQCNLPEGFKRGAAVATEPTQETLQAGLRQIMDMSDAERQQMGANGRALVEEQFTWPQVASKMREVYEWVLGGGSPPECVELRP